MNLAKSRPKEWLYRLAARIPEAAWDATHQEECLLPYYHMVSDEPVPHVSPLYRFRSVAEFIADLEHFLRRRRALSLDEFLSSVRATGLPPDKSFLLTFDDGFREMHDTVMPILIAKGVPAVFFLTSAMLDNRELCFHQKISLLIQHRQIWGTRFPAAAVQRLLGSRGISGGKVADALKLVPWSERTVLDEIAQICGCDFDAFLAGRRPYLDSDQVRTMLHQGFEIGAHSIDHPRYSDIPLQEQLRQTRESLRFLQERFDLKHRVFAFPHTDWNVSREFFAAVSGDGLVEATFGTSSPAKDCIRASFQRFTMEKTTMSARAILARQCLRKLKQRATGRSTIQRPIGGGSSRRTIALDQARPPSST